MLLHLDNSWISPRVAGQSNAHPRWEFYAVLKGCCAPVLEAANEPLPLRERTLWVFAPECAHRWVCPNDQAFQRIVLHFTAVPSLLDQIVRGKGFVSKRLTEPEARQLEQIARELDGHVLRPTAQSARICENRLLDLAALALARNDSGVGAGYPGFARKKVERALAWHGARLAERPSVVEVAKAMGLSSMHLRCLFRQVHGANPKAVFRQQRLERARQLLQEPGITLADVARRCGYASASHLCHENRADREVLPWQKAS